jgi:hypothetical protein
MGGKRDRVIKIPYTRVIAGQRYFEPRGRMVHLGFKPRSLGPDNEKARKDAWSLYERWNAVRKGMPTSIEPASEQCREKTCLAKVYPRDSIGEAWQRWIQSNEWKRLAASTRHKIWWEAWNKRIEPIFATSHPDSVTLEDISDWRQQVEDASGLDSAHKALKTWRAFWKKMVSLRYTELSDPSIGVINTEPKPRDQRYSHGEVVIRAKAAWRAGYYGLACIIITLFDTGFQPVDARTLRGKHRRTDPKTGRYYMDRSKEGRQKTGVPVIGTLSKFGDYLIRRYFEMRSVEMLPEALLFCMRTGVPYQESRLASDYATIRAMVDPSDKRQLRDMRRSGVIEVFTGADENAAQLTSEKFGNSIDRSNRLHRTYNPVDLEKVKRADEARIVGRRRRNAGSVGTKAE